MALAKSSDPRGLKRICLSCSTRFYDMNKRPIICPNCGDEFTGEVKIKARRGRLSALDDSDQLDEAQVDTNETDELEEEEDAKEVSLDEVAAADDGDDDDDADIDLDDDLDDDDLDDDDLDDDDDDIDVDIDEDDK